MTESQNRDLWFTLPPQRSLLVLWLFSAIPIPILKFPIFYSSSVSTNAYFPPLPSAEPYYSKFSLGNCSGAILSKSLIASNSSCTNMKLYYLEVCCSGVHMHTMVALTGFYNVCALSLLKVHFHMCFAAPERNQLLFPPNYLQPPVAFTINGQQARLQSLP